MHKFCIDQRFEDLNESGHQEIYLKNIKLWEEGKYNDLFKNFKGVLCKHIGNFATKILYFKRSCVKGKAKGNRAKSSRSKAGCRSSKILA